MKKLILVLGLGLIGCGQVPLITADGMTCLELAPGEDLPAGIGVTAASGPNRSCERWCSTQDGTRTMFWSDGKPVGPDPRRCQ